MNPALWTPFQWLSIPILAVLLLRELLRGRRGSETTVLWLLRCCIWLGAAATIAEPDHVTLIAREIGIQRGADLVLYLFVLTSIGTSFFFYSRYVRLQRQITQLVRHLAIQDARRGDERSRE